METTGHKTKSRGRPDLSKTKKHQSLPMNDQKLGRKETKSRDSLHSFFRRTKREKKSIDNSGEKNTFLLGGNTNSNALRDGGKSQTMIASLLGDMSYVGHEDVIMDVKKSVQQTQNLFRYKPREPLLVYAAKAEEPPPAPKKKKKQSKFMAKVTLLYEKFKKFRAAVRTDFPLRFFFYLLFLSMCTIYYFKDVDTPNSPYFKRALLDAFVFKNSSTYTDRYIKFNFLEIATDEEFWHYLLYTLNNQIYIDDDTKDKTVLGENHLVGPPRLRLIEVRDDTCTVPVPFKQFFQQCFGPYSEFNEVPRNERKMGTVYRNEKDNGFSRYRGLLNVYPGNGFIKILDQNREANMQTIRILQSEKWFQGGGRAFFIEMVFYNPNFDMFAAMKLVVERTSAGGILPSYRIQVMDLHRHIRPKELIVRVNKLIIWFFLVNYLILHIWGMIKEKIAYILRIWNLIEFTIAGLFIYFFQLRDDEQAASFIILNRTEEIGPWDHKVYNNIDHIVEINMAIQGITGLLYFLIWAKVFQYLNYTFGMSSVTVAIGDVVGIVWAYFTLYFMVVMAFAAYGCLLFGYMVDDFFTFQTSFVTMLRGIAHSFDFEAMYVAQPTFAFPYMVLFFICVIVLLLAALSMALIESYMRVVAVTKRPRHFTFREFFRAKYENEEDNVCWTSALYSCGFEPEAIPLLMMKYQLEPCEKSDPESLARIVDQEKASFQGQGKNYLIMQHEIASLKVRMLDLELVTQLMVWKCTDAIYKIELYGEGWAEVRKDKEAAKLMF